MSHSTSRAAERPALVSASEVPRWEASLGLAAGGIVAVAIAGAGLLLARVDVALLAVPLLVAVLWSWQSRPASNEETTATLAVIEKDSGTFGFTLSIQAAAQVALIVLRYSVRAAKAREIVLLGPRADFHGRVPALTHSGPQELVRIEYQLLGPDAASLSLPPKPLIAGRVVAPRRQQLTMLPLPNWLRGVTGSHQSSRPGDGGEFRDLHPFTSGDRLRRIDWKATARHAMNPADVYVRRTDTLADASVLIVLDSRDDLSEQIAQWNSDTVADTGTSSLDIAREAASSLAASYIHASDRVGFQDLSSRNRAIPLGSGGRHLERLLTTIENTGPAAERFGHHRPPTVPPGALVYLLSSLLDEQPGRLALHWRAAGHRVIAVDVLAPARFVGATRFDRTAHRIVMMERADRIKGLQAAGVEVLRWSEEHESLPRNARLRLLSRPALPLVRRGGRR